MTTKTATRIARPETAVGPPRDRILTVARELFYRHGIHAVGVDAIAEAAGTNKMTLYRHFDSKDALIAECLRQVATDFDAAWNDIAKTHAGDAKAQLLAWIRFVAAFKLNDRGCAFVNAAVELPDKDHPARRVVERHKTAYRDKVVQLCRAAGLRDPELLADELFLLCEGARVSIQSVGPEGPAARLVDMLQSLVAAHTPQGR